VTIGAGAAPGTGDPVDRGGDAAARAELVDGTRSIGGFVVVDDHDTTDGDAVVQRVERGRDVFGSTGTDVQECDLLDRRVGKRVGGRSLEESHALVEQTEAREAVSHRVEIGPREHELRWRRLHSEAIGDPHLPGLDVVRV